MRGNISKRGPQGEKGEKGDAPKISFEYDETTGDLYYEIDGIYMSSEEVEELLKTKSSPKYSYVTILGGDENWVEEEVIDSDNNIIGKRYGQAVTIQNAEITPNTMRVLLTWSYSLLNNLEYNVNNCLLYMRESVKMPNKIEKMETSWEILMSVACVPMNRYKLSERMPSMIKRAIP